MCFPLFRTKYYEEEEYIPVRVYENRHRHGHHHHHHHHHSPSKAYRISVPQSATYGRTSYTSFSSAPSPRVSTTRITARY